MHTLVNKGLVCDGRVDGMLGVFDVSTEDLGEVLLVDPLEELLALCKLDLGCDDLVEPWLDHGPEGAEDPGGVVDEADTERLGVVALEGHDEELDKAEVHVACGKVSHVKEDGDHLGAGVDHAAAQLHLEDGVLFDIFEHVALLRVHAHVDVEDNAAKLVPGKVVVGHPRVAEGLYQTNDVLEMERRQHGEMETDSSKNSKTAKQVFLPSSGPFRKSSRYQTPCAT